MNHAEQMLNMLVITNEDMELRKEGVKIFEPLLQGIATAHPLQMVVFDDESALFINEGELHATDGREESAEYFSQLVTEFPQYGEALINDMTRQIRAIGD